MKKTIMVLALMLAAITAFGAMTPAPKTSDHNGLSAETAMSTASFRDPPIAHPTQFSSVRAASLRTGAGRSSSFADTTYFAKIRVTSLGGATGGAMPFAGSGGGAASAIDPASAEAPMNFRRSMEFSGRRGLRSTAARSPSAAGTPRSSRTFRCRESGFRRACPPMFRP